MSPIREAFPSLVLASEHRPQVAIVPAQLGNDAGAIGAALIGFDRGRQ
jgi:predicted NBD/HSP70 family sugar kinase